ncbi:hypothetical protein AYJ54_00680 [Bradyrhizobium centrolobii]|uniref:Uncharacterized protein n=1 Tax=Bradyrhizobium centrolobii TaxID=1505087 RepID=A0A176YFP5_9BRAD|nr:hypothetical protein [Bradyrhizobium centrolobii]OAF05454.1 hypothetical protein AYJ54_00680 [Bradyrhizobium centrolobii]
MTVHSVTIQLRAPSDGDAGQVTEGFYKLEDGYLQMTFRDGRHLENPLYRVRLHDGADPKAIAGNLTRSIRRELSGEVVEGFTRNLSYGKSGVA